MIEEEEPNISESNYVDLAHKPKVKEDQTWISRLISNFVSNFALMKEKIPWCGRRRDGNLNNLSVNELMQMMDEENLNQI